MAADSTTIRLKLVVDTKGERVIFAETKEDMVDFLVNISCLPLGILTKMLSLTLGSAAGSLENIFKTFEDHGDRVMIPNPLRNNGSIPEPNLVSSMITSSIYFIEKCLGLPKQQQQKAKTKSSNEAGSVKRKEMYIVMDDLLVRPKSDVCMITLLKSLEVKDIASFETREVFLGKDEAVKLLKASMESKTVLTDVFLRSLPDSEVGSASAKRRRG